MGTDTHRSGVTRCLERRILPLPSAPVRRRAVKWRYTRIRMELLGSIVEKLIKRMLASFGFYDGPDSAFHRLGRKGCIACRKADKSGNTNFCTSCEVSVMQKSPAIIEIAEENETFKSGVYFFLFDSFVWGMLTIGGGLVAQQFKRSWRHTTPCPKVRAVYKIVPSQQNLDKYNTYRCVASASFPYLKTNHNHIFRDSVEARGHFTAVNRPPGNENRRWHGTRRKCTLGDKGCTTFCSDLQCSLCCIVKTSFDLAFFGKKTSWGRFGPGIYTSSTSSKFVSQLFFFPRPPLESFR